MSPRVSLKWLLFVGIAVIASFLVIILFLVPNLSAQGSDAKSVSAVSSQTSQDVVLPGPISPGLPVRLKIPRIKVDAAIEHVGLTSGGAVEIPKSLANVAWFKLGPRPGNDGNAVINGHYGWWKNGTLGVFNNLAKLKKGDKLYIEDDRGALITFIVRELKTYGPNETATAVFVPNDDKAHLNLVTCTGVWNKISKSYPNRLVIFADKEM